MQTLIRKYRSLSLITIVLVPNQIHVYGNNHSLYWKKGDTYKRHTVLFGLYFLKPNIIANTL